MPFDFFSSFDIGSFSDFGNFADFSDITSVVDVSGSEFLAEIGAVGDFGSAFDVPISDLANLDAWSEVGSFAGNADWFDTFSSGSILDSIPSIGDFNFSSITDSLPSLSSIKDFAGSVGDSISAGYNTVKDALPSLDKIKSVASTVSKEVGTIAKDAQKVLASYQKVAPAVNAAANALGIQNPINQIIQPLQGAIAIAGGAAGLAGGVSSAAGGLANVSAKISSTVASKEADPFEAARLEAEARNNESGPALASSVDPDEDPFEAARLAAENRNDAPGPTQAAVVDQLGFLDRTALAVKSFGDDIADLIVPGAAPGSVVARATAGTPGSTTDPYGLNILSDGATNAMVARNINPAFLNSFNDPGATGSTGLPRGITSQFTTAYDPETSQWSVFDNISGTTVRSGLTEQEAILAEQDLNITSGLTLETSTTANEDPYEAARQDAADRLDAAQPSAAEVIAGINSQTAALTTQARAQQSVRELRNTKAQSTDWRVRLKLAPNSNYLYNDPSPGILAALKLTDGVIFPYTPSIETAYKANYDPYDLTHSNYRGYFYKGSYVDAVNVRGVFTAQDTKEADYLLAVIHFFRSATKMFYGKDQQRGSPPPLVYLNGYGDYQFAEHPCVISQFNYTLPPDVDYIRCQSTLQNGTNRLNSRLRNPLANNPLSVSVNRLLNSNLVLGALTNSPLATANNLASSGPTYVPTKMEISITLFPMQSRSQISNNFSVKEFANGNLLKGGYW